MLARARVAILALILATPLLAGSAPEALPPPIAPIAPTETATHPVLAAPAPLAASTQPTAAPIAAPFTPDTEGPGAPGVMLIGGDWATSSGPQVVRLVTVDPSVPTTHLETSGPANGVRTLQTVGGQALRVSRDGHRVVAALNGDTWLQDPTTHQTAPTGLQVRAGEVLTAASGLRSAFGIGGDGKPMIADGLLATTLSISGGPAIAVDRVNKPRKSGLLQLFTRNWGSSTGTVGAGVEVVLMGTGLRLTPSGTWSATVAAVSSSGANTAIPVGGWVLSAAGADAALIKGLLVGANVTLTTTITAGWEDVHEALSGRDWLVRDGAVAGWATAPDATSAQPRSAIGIRADGQILMAAVDGRQPATSAGVTNADLAALLLGQGAMTAVSLDGGGSTTLYEREPGDVSATLTNVPSDGHERRVANALLVVSTVPTGPLAALVVRPGTASAIVGQTIAFGARGVDTAVNGVPVNPATVAWSSTGKAGVLGANGRFHAAAPGDATLTASVGGVTTSNRVTVAADTLPPVPTAPRTILRKGSAASLASVPLTVSWSATDVGTGVARYELQRREGAGAWTPVALPTALTRSIAARVAIGSAMTFRVRATDRSGNVSAWRASTTVGPWVRQQTGSGISYHGSWVARTGHAYLDGAGRASHAKGATVTYTFIGRGVAWIAPVGPSMGSATVSIDGTKVATVSLHTATSRTGRLAFAHSWTKSGRHTLTIRVAATAGHPWIAVDEFVVLDVASIYPTLVGAGDIASCSLTGDSATAALLLQQPGTVFAAGDIAYPTGSAAQFRDCYGPTWGSVRGRTRPVPGNHDYGTAGAAPYFAYFGSLAGTPGQGWYAYDMGAWRVYALNSNCDAIGGCGAGSPQETWLAADLAANPRQCVAAIWHHPLFSSGMHGNSAATLALWQDLYAAGADVVINGHDHDYERFAPQTPDGTADPATGIREFVVGTGGAELRLFATVRANSEVRRAGLHGVLRLALMPTGYAWRFIAAGSSWTDTGSATCH